MKKYVKPELMFESFELSQQIAACTYDIYNNTNTDEGCQFTDGNQYIFMSGCGGNVGDTPVWQVENYCYHNGSSSPYGIFNS